MGDEQEIQYDLDANSLARFTEAFNIWDKQQQGYILWTPDFSSLWRSIGQNPTEAELKEIQSTWANESLHFSLDIFLKICASDNPRYLKDAIRPEQLIESFKTYDKDGTGKLTVAQLRYVVQFYGDRFDEAEADEFIAFTVAKCYEEGMDLIDYEFLVEKLMERDPNNA